MCPTPIELSAYHDHELDAAHAAGVAEHIASCPECQRALWQMDRMTALLASAPRIEPSPEVLRHINRYVNQLPVMWLWKTAPILGGVAAAVLIVAGPPALRLIHTNSVRTAQSTPAAWESAAVSGSANDLNVERDSNSAMVHWLASGLAKGARPATTGAGQGGTTP